MVHAVEFIFVHRSNEHLADRVHAVRDAVRLELAWDQLADLFNQLRIAEREASGSSVLIVEEIEGLVNREEALLGKGLSCCCRSLARSAMTECRHRLERETLYRRIDALVNVLTRRLTPGPPLPLRADL